MGIVKRMLAKAMYSLTDKGILGFSHGYDEDGDIIGGSMSSPDNFNGWVAACVNVWGTNLSKAKFRLYDISNDDRKEIIEHPFLEMLNKPNDFMTSWEMKFYQAVFFSIYGNYYLLKGRNKLGQWKESYPLFPNLIKVVSSKTNYIDYYEYNLGAERIRIEKEDIVHFKFPNPHSFSSGRPLIANIMNQVEVDKYQTKYQKKFYKEGGFAGQMFRSPVELSTKSFNKTKEELVNKFGGYGNSFKVALLEMVEPIKAAYSIKDMDIGTQRGLTRDEILGGFQVPKILLGIGESINRATAEASQYQFASGIVDPVLTYTDEVFTQQVQEEFGDKKLIIKHDVIAPRDVEMWSNVNKSKFSVGAITINEMRNEDDYQKFPYELANVPIINVGGALVRLDTGEQLGQIPNDVMNKPQDKPNDGIAHNEDNPNDANQVDTQGNKAYTSEQRDLVWKQFNRRHKKLSFSFAKELEKYFNKQHERLLNALDVKSFYDIINIFENEDEKIIWINMVENYFTRAMEQGYKLQGGINLQNVKDELTKMTKLSTKVNETTKKKLIEAIQGKDLTKFDIQKILSDTYKQAIVERIPSITTTSLTQAFNYGALRALIDNSATSKTWITQRDGKERDMHFLADNQTVGILDPFFVGGEFLQYPGDPSGSAANTINCRCFIGV